MRWLKRAVRNWLNSDEASLASPVADRSGLETDNAVNFSIHRASGGYILEAHYRVQAKNSYGDSMRRTELSIIHDGDDIGAAVKVALVKASFTN